MLCEVEHSTSMGRQAADRVRTAFWPIALTAVAAALAWLVAHKGLGHAQPFFAPIAAAVSLSTSRIQRFRRIVQLVGGVLLGIGIAELLSSAIGISTVSLGVVVFVTLAIAVAGGAGFFAGGMMFANQAAASAILVVTLHKHGTGGERAIDALVGGGVSMVLGVLLFPAHPITLLRDAERRLLAELAATVEQTVGVMCGRLELGVEWSMVRGVAVHARVSELASARETALANVRIAPRRWRLRSTVAAEAARLARFDALADVVLAMARSASRAHETSESFSPMLCDEMAALGDGIRELAVTRQPWPEPVLNNIQTATERILARATSEPVDYGVVVAALLRTAAVDLSAIAGPSAEDRPASRPELA